MSAAPNYGKGGEDAIATEVFSIPELFAIVLEFYGMDQKVWSQLSLVSKTWYQFSRTRHCLSLFLFRIRVFSSSKIIWPSLPLGINGLHLDFQPEWDELDRVSGGLGDLRKVLPPFSTLQDLRLHGFKGFSCCHSQWALLSINSLTTLDLSDSDVSFSTLQEVPAFLTKLRSLDLSHCPQVTNECLRSLAALKGSLQDLNLSECSIFDTGLESLVPLQQLQKLRLNECPLITDRGLTFLLPCLPHLSVLELRGRPSVLVANDVSGVQGSFFPFIPPSLLELDLSNGFGIKTSNFSGLAHLRNLQALNLSLCSVSDATLRYLDEHHPYLRNLNLMGIGGVTPPRAGPRDLAPLPHLQELNLSLVDHVTATDLKRLEVLPSLKTLHLACCERLDDEGLQVLTEVAKNLQNLYLQECDQVTGHGLSKLANLDLLHELNVSSCEVTAETLHAFSTMPILQSLVLDDCALCNEDQLRALSSLNRVRHLSLRRSHSFPDEGLSRLSFLTALDSLRLEDCVNVTDSGLQALSSLVRLSSLSLSGCRNITHKGLVQALSTLTLLRSLNLECCRDVTEKGAAEVRRAFPFCSVKFF